MRKLYEQQLQLSRVKLSEKTANLMPPRAKRKSNKVENPKEPESDLADYTGADLAWDVAGTVDPTGVVDIVNAGRYALKGQYIDAGISLLGVVPYVGDLAKGGRVAKAGAKALSKAAVEVKPIGKTLKTATETGIESFKRPSRKVVPPSSKAERVAKSGRLKRAATTAGAAAAGFALSDLLALDMLNGDRTRDHDYELRQIAKTVHPSNLDVPLQKLSIFDPGEASGYLKTSSSRKGQEDLPPGYHPFFTGPLNIDLQRRRSRSAHSRGLPESVDHDHKFKRVVKRSVNSYLKSKNGKELNDYLKNIKKLIDIE